MHLAAIITLHLAFQGLLPPSSGIGCLRAECSHSWPNPPGGASASQALAVRALIHPAIPPILSHHPSPWCLSCIHLENALPQLLGVEMPHTPGRLVLMCCRDGAGARLKQRPSCAPVSPVSTFLGMNHLHGSICPGGRQAQGQREEGRGTVGRIIG